MDEKKEIVQDKKTKKNTRLAIILGLVACLFYGFFVLMHAING
jgi:succinate dehydrogenase hydrophobic anchor subunit